MNYIGKDNNPISAYDESCADNKIFTFRNAPKVSGVYDFFLSSMSYWENLTGTIYSAKIGSGVFDIPTGLFVMIGDEYGDFDWIEIDELIGRPHLTVMTFDADFTQWSISGMQIVGVNEGTILWPSPRDDKTKDIIPIMSNGTAIMVSEKDQHLRMQHYQVEIFTSNG